MPNVKDWQAHVYRTDGPKEVYEGFFLDEPAAKAWIKTRAQGTYEVRSKPPAKKKR